MDDMTETKRRRDVQVIVRATPKERAELHKAADAAGLSFQGWALSLMLREARKVVK